MMYKTKIARIELHIRLKSIRNNSYSHRGKYDSICSVFCVLWMLANLEGHCTNPRKDLSMCTSTLPKNLDSTFEVFNF